MAIISRLPGGGALSKNKVLTSFDLKKSANFGDIINQYIVDLYSTMGGMYYEDNNDGTGTLYVQGFVDSNCYIYVYKISGGTATKIHSFKVVQFAGSNITFSLKSNKGSNVVMLNYITNPVNTVYYFTKDTYEIKNISTQQPISGATPINGYIYITTIGDLSQPYLHQYYENGTFVRSFSNTINALYANSPTFMDSKNNLYLSFDGNPGNTSSYIIQSITYDGTLRWRKSMSDLGVSYGAKLLSVKLDGTSLWYLTSSTNQLLMLDTNGNILKRVTSPFVSTSFYINNVYWDKTNSFIYIQDISNHQGYLLDSNLEVIEVFKHEQTSLSGRIGTLWNDNAFVTVGYNSNTMKTYLDVREPYSKYMKR